MLVQHHIVECLVCTPGTTASTTSTTATTATATLVSESRSVVLAMLKRNNVVVHHATASVAKSDKIEQARCLAELSSLVDTSSSSLYTETAAAGHPDCLTFLHHMPSCAVVAAEAACRHLGLLTTTASSTQPQQAQRGYRILLGMNTCMLLAVYTDSWRAYSTYS